MIGSGWKAYAAVYDALSRLDLREEKGYGANKGEEYKSKSRKKKEGRKEGTRR